MSKDPIFKVGDKVRFELSPSGDTPRYNFGDDSGASGNYAESTVTRVRKEIVSVDLSVLRDGEDISWGWPLKPHSSYIKNQWSLPGFLKHVAPRVEAVKCTCNKDRSFTARFGHKKGCKSNENT